MRMPVKGESLFSYPITRHYPFVWFTPVVIIFGILFTVLFSVINLAANGYELETVYTYQLNATESESGWFQEAPWSWFSRIKPSCQAASLETGSTYFTLNHGLQYQISAIRAIDPNGTDIQGTAVQSSAYRNNVLENCTVLGIDIDMRRRDYSRANVEAYEDGQFLNNWWSWGLSFASAHIDCHYSAEGQRYRLNLTSTLPTMGETISENILKVFVKPDNVTQPSLFWGAQLLSAWYSQISVFMALQSPDNNSSYQGAWLPVRPSLKKTTVESFDYFEFNPAFYTNIYPGVVIFDGDWDFSSLGQWSRAKRTPAIAKNIDVVAKSYQFTILTDLGNDGPANGLTNLDTIKQLWDVLNDTQLAAGGGMRNADVLDVPINYPFRSMSEAFDYHKERIAPPEVHPATFFAQYACNRPRRKTGMSLFVTILVADIVLLQALWTVLNWIAQLMMRDKEKNYCQACHGERSGLLGAAAAPMYPLGAKHSRKLSEQDTEYTDGILSPDLATPGTTSPRGSSVPLLTPSAPKYEKLVPQGSQPRGEAPT